jgi:hypothetical protein
MKVNKAIYLRFNTTTSSTASINVPFLVKSIHIKSASYSGITPITANSQKYVLLESDLTNFEPMALLYNDTSFSAPIFADVSFQPSQPFNVNGTYNFNLRSPTGNLYTTPADDYITLILEFNGIGTADT